MSLGNRLSYFDHGPPLLTAEPELPQGRRAHAGQVPRAWECVNSLIALAERGATGHGQAVEEADAEGQCQLLARHRVNHALEDRGEARRLHTHEALGQRSQLSVVPGELVEFRQVDAQT